MKKVAAVALLLLTLSHQAVARKDFFSTTPEEDAVIVAVVLLILLLPILISYLGYRYNNIWLKVLGCIVTIPLFVLTILLFMNVPALAIIPFVVVIINIVLLSGSQTPKRLAETH